MCFLGNFCLKIRWLFGHLDSLLDVSWTIVGTGFVRRLSRVFVFCALFCNAIFCQRIFHQPKKFTPTIFGTDINSSLFCAWHSYGYTIPYAKIFCLFFWRGKGELPKMLVTFFHGASGHL